MPENSTGSATTDSEREKAYGINGDKLAMDVDTIAYMQDRKNHLQAPFNNYMESQDWIDNYHANFIQLLKGIPEVESVEELGIMIHVVKSKTIGWYEFLQVVEHAVKTFEFHFNPLKLCTIEVIRTYQ